MRIGEALEVLGLGINASQDEAKIAYRTLARALHSDLHQDKSEEQRAVLDRTVRRINEAYECVERLFRLPAPERERLRQAEDRSAFAAAHASPGRASTPAPAPPPAPAPAPSGVDEAERRARERAAAALRRAEENIRAARQSEWQSRSEMAQRRRSNMVLAMVVVGVVILLGVGALVVLLPRFGPSTFVPETEVASGARPAPSAAEAEAVTPLTEQELTGWGGRSIAVATCRNNASCAISDCAAIPLLRSLRTFYGFENVWIVYGVESGPDRLSFFDVARSVRPDRFSVAPRVIVADSAAAANRRLLGKADPRNACPVSFSGPVLLNHAAGRLDPETRAPGPEREAVLQLDDLRPKPGGLGAMEADFLDVDTGRTVSFLYGPRREGLEGPALPESPAHQSDVGSMYRIRYQHIEYRRGDQAFAANNEFQRITRITGETESRQFRDVPLVSNPRKVIRTLERLDLSAIRRCQELTHDPSAYQSCTVRLIDLLQRARRLDASLAEDLRNRTRNMSIE